MERNKQILRAATLYYLQDMTMETVAAELQVSRSSVSRMLKQARASGLVEVTVHSGQYADDQLEAQLLTSFGTRLHLVPTSQRRSLARLTATAQSAANLVRSRMSSGMTLGVAWGTTTSAIGRSMKPKPTHNCTVVQLNGAANTRSSGIDYASDIVSTFAAALGAQAIHFPVPAFFDFAETKAAMWRERSVLRVLETQRNTDIALFSVGAIAGGVPSRVYASGYLDAIDAQHLQQNQAVGDVCTVFLRADGSYQDIAINSRASGPNPEALSRIPTRICCVSGRNKVPALIAALRARVITDLVIDEVTASALRVRLQTNARPIASH